MKPFILTDRSGIYIIDLQQSVKHIDDAYNFVRDLVANGGSVMFVGTKKRPRKSFPPRPYASDSPTSTSAGWVDY